jgi:hypothetical protein
MITYAITVCNEHRELHQLLSFLKAVIDPEDNINVLVDEKNVTPKVEKVLESFDDIEVHKRPFCGNFSDHRNYHITKCKGDYIFVLDADEMPQEELIKCIKTFTGDILHIPRINIIPGCTKEWCKKMNFNTNHLGWINWPDYQGRYFKNTDKIRWSRGLHERLTGSSNVAQAEASPSIALWHIKSVDRQVAQDKLYQTL